MLHRPANDIAATADCHPAPLLLQRVAGVGRLRFRETDGLTRVAELYQQGACRLRLPRVAGGGPPEAVTINTAGGLTGGDRIDLSVALEDGTEVVVTSQAFEKVYRSTGEEARLRTTVSLAPASRLDWLAQPMIVFDRARIRRTLSVEMADDAAFLGIDGIVLGRTAMGEAVRQGSINDRLSIRRGGRLVLADAFRAGGNVAELLAAAGTAAGACAVATIVHCAPDAQARLAEARAILATLSGEAAASAWNGLLVLRLVSDDGRGLVADASRFLSQYRGRPVPRTWLC